MQPTHLANFNQVQSIQYSAMEEKDRKGMLQLNVAGAAEVLPAFLFTDGEKPLQFIHPAHCFYLHTFYDSSHKAVLLESAYFTFAMFSSKAKFVVNF